MNCPSSASHRCDEFPAEYSLASCSPAELASASSATLMLQPTTFVRRANLSERQPGNSLSVSPQGVTALTVQLSHDETGIAFIQFPQKLFLQVLEAQFRTPR